MLKHIAIAGNIGAGKTTLAERLGKHFNWEVYYEDVDHNPYLGDFYQDMPRWAFNLQVYFLNSRMKQLLDIQKSSHPIIQDRTIYEDAYIFAPNLFEMGVMNKRDFENYSNLFKTVRALFPPPDLLIYLNASLDTLLHQISKRGRDYEKSIRPDYLERLNHYYNNWMDNYKEGNVLVIQVDEINYADDEQGLQQVISLVEAKLEEMAIQRV